MNIESTVQTMTTAEKVGQMFMLAFAGGQMNAARILMAEHRVGGAYISNDNAPHPNAAIALTNALQFFARSTRLRIPLLLGADQEGTWSVMTSASAMGPGNMAIGAAYDPQQAYRMYSVIAKEMTAVGLNTVLGPAADCNSNPRNSIIGMRSFGEPSELVAAMTAAAVRGLRDNGAAAALKHFPGHGDARMDSHRGLPTVDRSREELFRIDLHPFAEGIKAGAQIVMTAHIIFSALDPKRPATLSPVILGDVLRGQLGFEGVIVSDSMNMQAIKRSYDPTDAVIQGFNAGVDLMMLAEEHYDHDVSQYLENQRALIRAVIQAVEAGIISQQRVDDAVGRILRLKREAGFSTAPLTDQAAIVGQDSHRAVELDVARRAVTVLRNRNRLVPIQSTAPLLLVNATRRRAYTALTRTRGIGPNQATPAFDVFAAALQQACPQLEIIGAEDFTEAKIPASGIIIAVTENYTLPGIDFDQSTQVKLVKHLHRLAADRLIVIALRDPYELANFPEIATYVCSYSFRASAAQAAADILLGRIAPRGHTPVTVPDTELAAKPM